jgi:YD repeat-containing protein
LVYLQQNRYALTSDCGSTSYDLITFHGSTGTQRTIRVWYANLGDVLRTTQPGDVGTLQTLSQLFPPSPTLINGTQVFNPRVVSSVELPNSQAYQFRYNAYGELARVELSTGGAFEYDYAAGVVGEAASGMILVGDHYEVYRQVVTRRAYLDGTTGSLAEMMTYSRPESLLGEDLDYVVVDHYKPDGVTRLAQERHYYHGKATDSFTSLPTQYSPWKQGREIQTEALDADGATVLRRTVNTWQQRVAVSWWPPGYPDSAPSNDPRIVETVTTLADTNLVSRQTFGYDQYNNRTNVYEYDFGAGAPGPLIRRTHTDYVTFNNGVDYAGDYNIHIRNLPLLTQVFDAGGTKRAETLYEYDLYDNSLNHAPLIDRRVKTRW